MKKQLWLMLLVSASGSSMFAVHMNMSAQYKKVDMYEDAIKKHADNIEDAIESFVSQNNLDKTQYRLVSKWEKAVIRHADNIEDMIEKCCEQQLCLPVHNKINKELQLLDRTSGYLISNANKFLQMYPDAQALHNKINDEIEQLNKAISNFEKEVDAFIQQHNQ